MHSMMSKRVVTGETLRWAAIGIQAMFAALEVQLRRISVLVLVPLSLYIAGDR